MFDRNAEPAIPYPKCGFKKNFKLRGLKGTLKYICDGCKKYGFGKVSYNKIIFCYIGRFILDNLKT